MTNKLDLSIDASGKVVLADETLNELESHFVRATAGGLTNSGPCDNTTNGSCSNTTSCTGSTNTVSCMNSRSCAVGSNDGCQAQ